MSKIMLVEDDNNLREIYGERLIAEGYEIVSAKDGEEALAMAVKEKPDLIISDVMMPKISGFDMLDILRQTPETKNTKVIMMTALSQAEDKERASSLGADKYLVKSQVTLEDVARVVHDVLNGPEEPTSAFDTEQPTMVNQPIEIASEPVTEPSEQTLNPTDSTPVADVTEPTAIITEQVVDQQSPMATEPVQENEAPDQPVLETTEPISTATVPSVPSEPVAEPASPIVTQEPVVNEDVTPELPAEPIADQPPIASPQQQEAPVVNPMVSGAPEASAPIPVDENPSAEPTSQPVSSAEELNAINKQLETFVATEPSVVAPHESPLVEPTDNQINKAEIEDRKIVNADPSVIPPASDPNIAESASTRKKVISPISDPSVKAPSINELYEKELAAENAFSPVENPTAGANIAVEQEKTSDPTTNPMVGEMPSAFSAPLETADLSKIDGVTTDALDDKAAEDLASIAPAPEQTPVAESQPLEVKPAPTDPNDPNQIAL
ncbi:response regulator [Candidatus Saccharibacteria bacterium]|nr:response regulator [Candidatus Saccharibacteria bacterium]